TISTEELHARFDTIWAVSDVHGRLRELDQLLLAANLVTHDGAGNAIWNALGFRGAIAMDRDGWFIKLDTGLKAGRSRGMLLRCDVARLVHGSRLAMIGEGRANCDALTPDGTLREVPR